MGNLNTNKSKVNRGRPFNFQHNVEAAKLLNFKLDRNHDQVNSDSTKRSSQKDFLILHQNIRGLKGKTEEIMDNIATSQPHVLCFTEHHLKSHQLDCIQLQNYRLVAKFCRITYRYGGVCIYVHESLQSSNMEVLRYCKEKDLEVCSVRLYLPTCTICIVNLYRSPLGNFDYFLKELEILLNVLSRNSRELIICGDFNVNFMEDTTHKKMLNSLLATFGLYSTVDFPTRIYNNSITTIDNIFINIANQNNFSVYPYINGLSDHDAQIIVLNDFVLMTHEKQLFSYRSFNEEAVIDLNIKLSYESWEDVLSYNDVNLSFNDFLNIYLTIFYSSFPTKAAHNSSHPKAWLTQGIKISCRNKRKLYLVARHSLDQNKKVHYRKYCKILAEVIKLAKRKHYNNLLMNSANKTKTTWNIINENINKRHKKQDLSSININGVIIQNTQAIANTFNSYYSSVANHITKEIHTSNTVGDIQNPVTYLQNMLQQSLLVCEFKHVSPKEIENVAKSLKDKDSHGYDEIPTKVIKQSISYISSPLAHICNLMFSSGTFPTRLKFAEIIPIYKKGERMDIANYRPISILPSFSKIFEKVILKRLIQHFDYNKILVNEQFGFRNKTSTTLASFHLTSKILEALNNRLLVGGIFCDLRKAFDCVDHKTLLEKLYQYGITGEGLKLLTSYLKDRKQRVIINSRSKVYRSDWEPIQRGVPQGSVLGPLLFLIYINDLPQTIKPLADPVLFADDTSMIVKSTEPGEFLHSIQSNISNVDRWFKSNSLLLNMDKTHLLQFSTKNSQLMDLEVHYENKQITAVNSIKFLGLEIDSTLSWKQHIDSIIPKLNKACFAVRQVKPYMALEALRMIYFSYFHSIVTYGIIFWGNSVHSQYVFKTQKRMIRIIADLGVRDSCRCVFKKLGILPLYSQYLYSLLMFVAENRDLFQTNFDVHSAGTRYKNDLHLPPARLKVFQQGTFYSGIRAFNHLPKNIKDLLHDVKHFKRVLKHFS